MIKLFFIVLFLLFAYLGQENVTKVEKVRVFVRIALILLLSAFAVFFRAGADRLEYINFYDVDSHYYKFEDILYWLSLESIEMEPGFVLLTKIIQILGIGSTGFIFLITVLINTLAVSSLYRFKYPFLVIFLFLSSLTFAQESNLLRQMLAVMIGFYAIQFIEERNWKKYLLYVFIAFTIHKTALLLLIGVPFIFIKEKHHKTVFIVMLAVWIISLGFVFGFFKSFDYLSIYFEDTRYNTYADEGTSVGAHEARFDLIYNALTGFLFLCLFVFSKNKPPKIVFPSYYILGCSFLNMTFGGQFVSRLALYFIPMFCAYTPYLLTDNNLISKDRQTRTIIFALLFLYYLRQLLRGF